MTSTGDSERGITVVAIHGVGVAEVGSIAVALTPPGHELAFDRSTLVIDRSEYTVLTATQGPPFRIIEVNWADILKPRATLAGAVQHLVSVLLGMIAAGDDWYARLRSTPHIWAHPTRWFRWFSEAVAGWAILVAWTIMLLVAYPSTYVRVGVLSVSLIALALLTISLSRLSRYFRAGWVWIGLISIIGLSVVIAGSDLYLLEKVSRLSSHLYTVAQQVLALLLTLAVVAVVSVGSRPWIERLTHAAFFYVPFYGLTAVIIVLSTAGLIIGEQGPNYEVWEGALNIKYDLWLIEIVHTVAVFTIGLVALFIMGRYFHQRWKNGRLAEGQLIRSGSVARLSAALLLFVAPLVFSAVGIRYLGSIIDYTFLDPRSYQLGQENNILDVYQYSILRILPFIPFMVGPAATVLDIVGDVAFFLAPSGWGSGIREQCRTRFGRALKHAWRDLDTDEVVIVSHSQGTVIALDAIQSSPDGAGKPTRLITLGSPIDSLYGTFLRSAVRLRTHDLPEWLVTWVNYYRADDYIGGPIAGVASEAPIGPGGHGNYWKEDRVRSAILRSKEA